MPLRTLPRLRPALLLSLMMLSVGFTAVTCAMRGSQAKSVAHTVSVLAKIEEARAAQSDVRYRERNVVLGGRADDKRAHDSAIREVEDCLDDLERLTAENHSESELMIGIKFAWGKYVRKSQSIVRSPDPLAGRAGGTMSSDHLRRFLDVGLQLHAIRLGEERLLAVREAALSRTYGLFNAAIVGTSIFMGLSFLLLASLTRREHRAREFADAALAAETASLERATLRLENLAEAAFEGIAITQDGVVRDANTAFATMFGYDSVENIKGVRAELFAAPESRDYVVAKRTSLDEEPYEAVLQRADGSKFPGELRGRHIEVGGRPARVTAVRDLSSTKAAERALRQTGFQLTEAQRVARIGSWEWDIATDHIAWSAQLFRLYDLDVSTGVPSFDALMEMHHPLDRASLLFAIESAVRDGQAYEVEVRIVQSDGTYRWMRAVGEASRGKDGSVDRLFGTLMDIDAHKLAELELSQAGRRLTLATEAAESGVWEFDLATGELHWDARMYALWGLPPQFASDPFQAFAQTLHPQDRDRVIARAEATLQEGESMTDQFRIVWPDGDIRHIESYAIAERGEDGSVVRMIGINRDVTARREAQIERERSEERFRILFECSPDAHLILRDSAVIACNPAAVLLMRCAGAEELLGLHPASLSPETQPDGRPSMEKAREMDALVRKNGFHRFDWTHRRRDGETFPAEVTLTNTVLDGAPVILAVLHDLTEIKTAERRIADYAALLESQRDVLEATNTALRDQESLSARRLAETEEMNLLLESQRAQLDSANQRLSALATIDGLTGLTNQRTFRERLAEACAESWRHGRDLSLLMLDVDRFKSYNDTFGHPAGDQALRKVADVLRAEAREYDIAARNGGEEFALLLPSTDSAGAARVAERVRQAVESESWPLRPVTVSVGFATLLPAFFTLDEFIEAADRALYSAKDSGRNRVATAVVPSRDDAPSSPPSSGAPSYPMPIDEAERLVALAETELFGSSPEEAYDTLAETAAMIFNVPISLVSLVGADSQWLKARVGLDVASTSRDVSFCTHAMLGDRPMVVEDATTDARFANNALVTGDPGIRFYAGAPIRTAEGFPIGALCAIDRVPRKPTEGQLRLLERLARQAARIMESSRRLPTLDSGERANS